MKPSCKANQLSNAKLFANINHFAGLPLDRSGTYCRNYGTLLLLTDSMAVDGENVESLSNID